MSEDKAYVDNFPIDHDVAYIIFLSASVVLSATIALSLIAVSFVAAFRFNGSDKCKCLNKLEDPCLEALCCCAERYNFEERPCTRPRAYLLVVYTATFFLAMGFLFLARHSVNVSFNEPFEYFGPMRIESFRLVLRREEKYPVYEHTIQPELDLRWGYNSSCPGLDAPCRSLYNHSGICNSFVCEREESEDNCEEIDITISKNMSMVCMEMYLNELADTQLVFQTESIQVRPVDPGEAVNLSNTTNATNTPWIQMYGDCNTCDVMHEKEPVAEQWLAGLALLFIGVAFCAGAIILHCAPCFDKESHMT